MANLEVKVRITDLDLFTELVGYLKEVIFDERMPGELANEMQEKIGEIIITLDGKEINKSAIVSEEDIQQASIINIISRMFAKMMGY